MNEQLSPKVIERLCITQEECGELVQAISKVFRFGLNDSYNGVCNRDQFIMEAGDLYAMILGMVDLGLFTQRELEDAAYAKEQKLAQWTKHK